MARSTGSREPARQAALHRRQRRERRRRRLSVLAGVVVLVTLIAGAVLLVQDGETPGPADAGSAIGWDASAFTGGPRLAVDQTVVDHGSVPYGHEVEASYRLKNVGDQLLRIDNPEVTILDGC